MTQHSADNTASGAEQAAKLSVAPMMDWTDRHCRVFHRQMSRRALLYTEMVTSAAIIHGDRSRLLDFDAAEHPVALQIGGSEPAHLREAARIAADWGYAEINLNVGCPSDRVQSGCFGAVLMKTPELVAECVSEMMAVSAVPVTVKCRIGVDKQISEEVLPAFIDTMYQAGIRRMTIHARKAWLSGLSPRENREIPPLDYALVHRMKHAFPGLHLSINGGIARMADIQAQLEVMDGVMVGRAAYHEPWLVLGQADRLWNDNPRHSTPQQVAMAMRPFIVSHLANGGRLHQITRHMLGLFHAMPGARHWRRVLSEGASGGGVDVYDAAMRQLNVAAA